MTEPGQTDLSKYYTRSPSPTEGQTAIDIQKKRSDLYKQYSSISKPRIDEFSDELVPFDDEDELIDVESSTEDGLTAGQATASLGIDIGGSIGSQIVGAMTGPGYLPIAFGGGLISNITAQMVAEGRSFNDISWGRAVAAGFINLIPGSSTLKLARPIATEVGRGALIGAADITMQKAIDEKRMPTAGEYLMSAGLGGALGGVIGSGVKHFNEARGMVYGMSYSDIDKLILTKEGEPLRRSIADLGYDWSEDRVK